MKRVLFLVIVLVGALWLLVGFGKHTEKPGTQATLTKAVTQTPIITCQVSAGIDSGRVNLRTCAGTSCAGLSLVYEGQTLKVIERGDWLKVVTADNLTGYIKSKYCKGK